MSRSWTDHERHPRDRRSFVSLLRLRLDSVSKKGADPFDLPIKITDEVLSSDVLLIGETHQKEQSFILVKALLARAWDTHPCVALVVEIPSDQQDALDAVGSGAGTMDQVEIWAALDFPPYRTFLIDMLEQSAKRPCFRVYAVDLPETVAGSRDAWMADRIIKYRKDGTPVIALLGTLHVVRGIRYTSNPADRNVADRLLAATSSVVVLAQDWPLDCTPGWVLPGMKAYAAFMADINRMINGTVTPIERWPVDVVFNWCP